MSYESYRDGRSEDRISPKSVIADEGNVPGTPSSTGVALLLLLVLVGLGLLYLSTLTGGS